MSNIYISEPPTSGKVLLKTTVGDIDIELWAKETPKTSRNFIQLCLEGYYDGTIFHRVVKDFIVQGGDPKGDGTGGESIYQEPFKDEFHQRLRFVRRGLLAMANAGRNDNGSQFFFTLASTAELQNKHTIFGKVTGETLFNMLKLGEGLIENERPEYPHKIISTEVLNNPFPDIVPRIRAVKGGEKKKKKRTPGVKNFKLLSFGEEAEEDEEEAITESKKFSGKSKSTHDILNDPKLSSVSVEDKKVEEEGEDEEEEEEDNPEERLERIKNKLKAGVKNDQKHKMMKPPPIKRVEEDDDSDEEDDTEEEEEENDAKGGLQEIKKKLKTDGKSNRKRKSSKKSYYSEDEEEVKKKKREEIKMEIENVKREYQKNKLKKMETESEEMQEQIQKDEVVVEYKTDFRKYKDKSKDFPKKGSSREDFTQQLLSKFKNKLIQAKEVEEDEEKPADVVEEEDDESTWMRHKLHFESGEPILAKDANTKDGDWFDMYDPRNPLNQRRRGESSTSKQK